MKSPQAMLKNQNHNCVIFSEIIKIKKNNEIHIEIIYKIIKLIMNCQ